MLESREQIKENTIVNTPIRNRTDFEIEELVRDGEPVTAYEPVRSCGCSGCASEQPPPPAV